MQAHQNYARLQGFSQPRDWTSVVQRDWVLATELIFIEVTNYNKISLIFFIFHFKYVNNTRLICIDKGSPSRLAIAHEHAMYVISTTALSPSHIQQYFE